MSQSTTRPPRRFSVKLRIGLGLLLLLIVSYAGCRYSSDSAIRKLEAEIRAKGEPVTLAELQNKYPPIPDEANAAVAFIQIWKQDDPEFWEAFFNGDRDLPSHQTRKYNPALPYLGNEARKISRGEPLSPASLAAADEFLQTNAARFVAVQAALTRPQFRFPVEISQGLAALLPHLSVIKQEAVYLQIAALVAAERNDTASVLAELRSIVRLGEMLAAEPVLISQLVRLSTTGLMIASVEQWLSRQTLQATDLEQLRLMLEAAEFHGVARFSLVGERAFSLSAFDPNAAAFLVAGDTTSSGEETPEQSANKARTGFKLLRASGYLLFDQRLMLETFKDGIALAEQETPESLTEYEALFEAVDRKARQFPPKIFSAMMLPALKKVPARFAAYEARRRATLLALAVERYRLANDGERPSRLDDLMPDLLSSIPIDPFDGQPLRFQKLERGYVIYSVGQDRKDNGGKEYIRGTVEGTDITFTVSR